LARTVYSLAEIPTIIVTTWEYYLNVDCVNPNAALLVRDVTFCSGEVLCHGLQRHALQEVLSLGLFLSDRSGLKMKALLYL
jgi:hypothetical protein